MKRKGVNGFSWQAGYGTFSIGQSHVSAVVRYIQQQEHHHRRLMFQDELRQFFDWYGISYDERYVWD